METLEAIRTRRSFGRLLDPAPNDDDLEAILLAGAAAPDHGELRPFRFTVLRGEGLDAFGVVLEEAYRRRCHGATEEVVASRAEKERTKLRRAPLVVVVSAVRQDHGRIPWEDQRHAAAAATQNLLLAAHALGYGAMWRTGEPCTDPTVKTALDLTQADAIVGFVYIGSPPENQLKRVREVALDGLVRVYSPARGSGRPILSAES